MPIILDEQTYYENVDMFPEEFYRRQREGARVSSSQPSPDTLLAMWEELLKENDQVVYIPMSSGLSGSCETAAVFAREFGGRVQVVDNVRISLTQLMAVGDAKYFASRGMSALEIKEILEREALDASIYVSVETLTYLKKSGRITPAVATLGNVLNIKPVMAIQGGKLDLHGKVRGRKAAFQSMVKALRRDIETRFAQIDQEGQLVVGMACTFMPEEELKQWRELLQAEFPGREILYAPLTLSIGCHLGPGALGVGAVRRHWKA